MGVLTCYRTRRRIGAYLAGALDDAAARAAALHLETCGACQGEADGLRRLRARLGTVLDPSPPTDWTGFWPGIVRGIAEGRTLRPLRVHRRAWRPGWAFGGVLAAVLLISLSVWQFIPGSGPVEEGVLVRSAGTEDPRGTVMVYSPPERDVAVVWVFDLD